MITARGFVLPTLYLALAAGVAGLVAGAGGARVYYRGQMAQEALQRAEAADVAAEHQRAAARAYEAAKAAQQQRAATAARKVDRELDKNLDWSSGDIPLGVRDELERAAAAIGAGKPGTAVPAVPGRAPAPQ